MDVNALGLNSFRPYLLDATNCVLPEGFFLDPLDVYTMYGMVVKACGLRVCFLLKSHVRNF